MRNINQFKVAFLAAMASAALTVGTAVHAELPAAVSTAIDAYETDALAAAALVIAAGVAIWGLLKLAAKFGWK